MTKINVYVVVECTSLRRMGSQHWVRDLSGVGMLYNYRYVSDWVWSEGDRYREPIGVLLRRSPELSEQWRTKGRVRGFNPLPLH